MTPLKSQVLKGRRKFESAYIRLKSGSRLKEEQEKIIIIIICRLAAEKRYSLASVGDTSTPTSPNANPHATNSS